MLMCSSSDSTSGDCMEYFQSGSAAAYPYHRKSYVLKYNWPFVLLALLLYLTRLTLNVCITEERALNVVRTSAKAVTVVAISSA